MNTKAMQAQVDYFASHLQDGRNASIHTVRSYTTDLNQFITWLEKDQLTVGQGWSSVTYLMIRRYLGHLNGEGYNRRSVVRKLSSLKAFYKWMEREGSVSHNPAAQVLSPKMSKPLPDVLEIDEVEKLLSMPDGKTTFGLRDRALLETLYATGMRVAEAAALTLPDVDWRSGEARVVGGKGNKERVVLLGRYALEALKPYLEKARPSLMARRKNKLAGAIDAVWINARGTQLSSHAIYMMVLDYTQRANLTKKVTPHTLRHSFATHMLQGGADLRVVQELLGHQSLSSTQIYTRIGPAHLKSVYQTAHPRANVVD